MRFRVLLIGLLGGGLLVSCQSGKGGGETLAENGGYSDGNFYGDSEVPTPSGYPRDGETFATNDGVPFGHNDPVRMADSGMVVERRVVDPAPEPSGQRVAVSRAAADPYGEAYGDGGGYGADGAVERAEVTPYVERVEPVPVVTSPKVVAKPKSSGASTKGNSKKAVVAAAKPAKKKQGSAVAASGKKAGSTVKTVYTPSSKSKSGTKKKATGLRVHTVKRGDTLSKLAGQYGVTVAQLKRRNQLTSDTIVVGKRLTVD